MKRIIGDTLVMLDSLVLPLLTPRLGRRRLKHLDVARGIQSVSSVAQPSCPRLVVRRPSSGAVSDALGGRCDDVRADSDSDERRRHLAYGVRQQSVRRTC